MTEPLIVINPGSGSTHAAEVAALLRERIGSHVLLEFPDEDPISAIERELDTHQPDRIICCGGDGTVSAVATAIAARPVELAVLPGGTANLLARSLGIPTQPSDALEALLMGTSAQIDTLEIGERQLLCRAAFGDFARPGHGTPSQAKRQLGAIAYPAWSLERAWKPNPRRFRLTVDGVETSVRASSLVIANVPLVGLEELTWARQASPFDGAVEVIALHNEDLGDSLETLWTTAASGHVEGRCISRTQAHDSIHLEWDGEIEAVLDGEPATMPGARLRVCPGSLTVLRPAAKAARAGEAA